MGHIETIQRAFPHSYEFDYIDETPSAIKQRYYYPGASTDAGRDGILVEVRPANGCPWFGTFAFGHLSSKGASGIFTTPDPQRLCVVARGAGYFVSADRPTIWEPVLTTPIIDVRPIPAQDIIVFANYTELVAYGHKGIKWATSRLAWDSLHITEVTDRIIRGRFWDLRSEALATFVVDLATGESQGGIEDNPS